jgi:hypothetical protein
MKEEGRRCQKNPPPKQTNKTVEAKQESGKPVSFPPTSRQKALGKRAAAVQDGLGPAGLRKSPRRKLLVFVYPFFLNFFACSPVQ